MLGFGSLVQFALEDVGRSSTPPPAVTITAIFSRFEGPSKKLLTAAVIASTGVIAAPFIPQAAQPAFAAFSQPLPQKPKQVIQPTPAIFIYQQPYVFSRFDQPLSRKSVQIADTSPWLEQEFLPPQVYVFSRFDQPFFRKGQTIADSSAWLEQEFIPPITWGWNAQWDQPKHQFNIAAQTSWNFSPFVAPTVILDPFVKWTDWRKKKKKKPSWEIQDEERSERRKAIELAVYGPPIEYKWNPLVAPPPPAPINTEEVMQAIMNALDMAERKRIEEEAAEEEAIIEMMLKDEQ